MKTKLQRGRALMAATLASAAGIGALFSAGYCAHADPATTLTNNPNVVSEKVSFWDLDQHSAVGAKRALHRIRAAAEDICGPEPTPSALELGADYRQCMAKSVDRAVADLHNPLVAGLNGEGGRPVDVLAERGR